MSGTAVSVWDATVVRTTNVAPLMKTVNTYSVATGGYTVTLPALNSVSIGARTMIEKDRLAVDGNLITVQRAGTDTFYDGTPSFTINSAGQQVELQVVLVGGVRYWKRFDGGGGSGGGGITASSTDTLSNKTLTAAKIADNGFIADNNGNEQLVFHTAPAAVNQIEVYNAATGGTVGFAAAGADSAIPFNIVTKGGAPFSINSVPAVTTTGTQTLTNKKVVSRSLTITSSATPAINTDLYDTVVISALAVNITSMTSGLTGTPADPDQLWIGIVVTATRTITWGTGFESSTVTLPTSISGPGRVDLGFIRNNYATTPCWRLVAMS